MSVLDQALPILLLIGVGVALRLFSVVSSETIEEIKKLVVTLVLPSVLFSVFLELKFETAYVGLFILVAAICVALYLLGLWIGRLVAPHHPYFPFLFTGFEYGMLGISLFGAAYGLNAIGYVAVVDLAHELFIWFVFAPLLMIRRDGNSDPAAILGMFVTSPVVIGLVGGIVFNALGLADTIKTAPVLSSVYAALQLMTGMAVPLILIIVGHGIRIEREGLNDVLVMTGLRYALIVPAALLIDHFVVAGLLGLGPGFRAGFFTLMILPPPFIIPLFMQKAAADEKTYVTNVLAVSTLVSLAIFSIYLGFHPVV